MTVLLFILAGMLIGLPCCVLVPRMLARGGYLDMPTARSSHVRPTPKGGGVGVVLAFAAGSLATDLPAALWVPAVILAALSFANDLRHVSAGIRLLAQIMAATVTLGWAWWSGWLVWPGLLLGPAVFFVVATTNCYNFMDGINGMAGLTGIVALTCLTAYSGATAPEPTLVTAMVIGAMSAFLPFNLPRARLFLGDVGSIFLGFFFSVAACLLAGSWTDFLVHVSFLFPFYADEAATIVERLWRRESLLRPHRRHLYQFLANEHGMAHWKVSAGYAAVQGLFAILVMHLAAHGWEAVVVAQIVAFALWGCLHYRIKRHDFLSPKVV